MRSKSNFKHVSLIPDEVYGSLNVSRFINYVMRDGKKDIARNLVYKAFQIIENNIKKPALEIFDIAIANISPQLEVKSRRIGGATYQVPVEVKTDRARILAYRWLITSARKAQGKTFDIFLANEIEDAYNNTGSAVVMKQNMHKAAEANKAFAHFARF
ncbi:MAG: small subunit ribosomal protein S7 [Candidatus Berkelbacteria bacterium Licking1014_85]|uniref:Small ribosomal subunit protein uS7 n=1 Tax=Candidatus Berkelbacteria bacterium Licking1014_85 TaxID=2017148 RepID=A0A554LMN0_9BACT|nr:MAG: small subunit ribosomal protein S7 [Candidatus Berkelbacteria bacterium Licking1014_85]